MTDLSKKNNFLFTLFSNFGGMFTSTMISFISVPISLGYWKVEKYGVWALITSILVYLSVSNLGLNSAASILMAKNPKVEDKLSVLFRTFLILIVSVLIGCTIFILMNIFYKNWIFLLGKIPTNLSYETYLACFILGVFFFINMPFTLITSVFNGFQKTYIENTFSILLTINTFVTLILVICLNGNLVTFAIFSGMANLFLNLIKLIYFYFFIYKRLNFDKALIIKNNTNYETSYKNILITGIRLFFVGIAAMIVWNSDNFVISNFIGIKEITPYAVTFKIYIMLFNIVGLINNSILPLVGRESGNNNWEWINKIYSNFIVFIATVGGLTWIGGLLFFRDIIEIWAGKGSYAGLLTVFSLGGYSYLLSMVNLNMGFVTSLNYIKGLLWVGWLEALVKLGFSILLVKFLGIGGVALGTFLGSLFAPTWLLPLWIVKRSNYRVSYNLTFVLKHFSFIIFPLLIVGIMMQLYVNSIYLRIMSGIAVISFYVILSYISIPIEVKSFLGQNMEGIAKKLPLKLVSLMKS